MEHEFAKVGFVLSGGRAAEKKSALDYVGAIVLGSSLAYPYRPRFKFIETAAMQLHYQSANRLSVLVTDAELTPFGSAIGETYGLLIFFASLAVSR